MNGRVLILSGKGFWERVKGRRRERTSSPDMAKLAEWFAVALASGCGRLRPAILMGNWVWRRGGMVWEGVPKKAGMCSLLNSTN